MEDNKKKSFYITTTLPYVNAPLHLGHAVEIIRADAIARYKMIAGCDVFFNTGTDEHGQKIFESAVKAGKEPQDYVDYYANLYKETTKKFGITEDVHYIRTTDEYHIKAAQEFWNRVYANGYIEKRNYKAKYCVGCEEEKSDSDLVDGKCPEHDRVPELIDEENYFFKFSAFEKQLSDMYISNPGFIVPNYRMNEMTEFIKRGLQDFSISRLKSKMSWGIPVPGDDEHVMYVWFDALTNYINTLGWPEDKNGNFQKYWVEGNPTQYCGKNNTRFQGLMWQAMLMAAKLPPTKTIVVDGFILGEGGIKMSKSLGNTIDPLDIINEYGTDALRYFVLREFHPFEDTAVSKNRLKEIYNGNLADGLGNLVSRILALSEKYLNKDVDKRVVELIVQDSRDVGLLMFVTKDFDSYDIKSVCDTIWLHISDLNKKIAEEEVFKVVKVDLDKARSMLIDYLSKLATVAFELEAIMPQTAKKIQELIKANKKPETPLFLRK